MQFDTVKVPVGSITGSTDVLTVICLFSRWCWVIPVVKVDGPNIGQALLTHVFAPFCIYPEVLRSDNAKAFTGAVVQYINAKLEIRHITGSVYHPQSQGTVERMHRTFTSIVRSICQTHEDDWEVFLPFAVGRLRTMEMASLGGRSPYEVVTGMKPVLPATIKAKLPVIGISVDDYTKQLVQYLEDSYAEVHRAQAKHAEKRKLAVTSRTTQGIEVGDAVLVRKRGEDEPKGSLRFTARTLEDIYIVVEAPGVNTFRVAPLTDPDSPRSVLHPADRLVKLDLPEGDIGIGDRKTVEVHDETTDEWKGGTLLAMSLDGRVQIRYAETPDRPVWTDLAKHRYRWVVAA